MTAFQNVPPRTPSDNRNEPATKRCAACKRTKSLDQFGRNKTGADGRRPDCLECMNAKRRSAYHREVGLRPKDEEHLNRRRLREAILEAQGDPLPGTLARRHGSA